VAPAALVPAGRLRPSEARLHVQGLGWVVHGRSMEHDRLRLNLLAVARTSEEERRVSHTLERMSVHHPSRTLILLAQEQHTVPKLEATVSAFTDMSAGRLVAHDADRMLFMTSFPFASRLSATPRRSSAGSARTPGAPQPWHHPDLHPREYPALARQLSQSPPPRLTVAAGVPDGAFA